MSRKSSVPILKIPLILHNFQGFFQVTFISKSGLYCKTEVPSDMHALTRCVCAKNFKSIANCAWKIPELQKELIDMLLRKVESESTNLCTSKTSPFKAPSVESMKEFSLTEQENEVKSKSPLLWQIITATGTNEKSIARNKRKTKEDIRY